MVRLFNRKARLTIGELGKLSDQFTDFRIRFDITMDDEIKPNKAVIEIFNISANQAGLIVDVEKPYVRLEIGYGDYLEVLYDGDVSKPTFSKNGTETVLKIEAGEGQAANAVKVNKSYNKGALVKDILQQIIDDIVEGGELIASAALDKVTEITGIKIKSGEVVKGRAIDKLKQKLKKYGYQPTINKNRQLTFVQIGQPENFDATLVNQRSGMIGTPIITKDGFQFVSKITPGIVRPLYYVQIESNNVNGNGTVRKCHYTGDTHGQDWHYTAEATWLN